ncbi:mRNA-decapping enzyme subunit 1 [[Candida] jaroonii]|uniref:mRNA-decapping enzyme subunit 1 n=1 Tax=[Candida] jaroonii TaxID=467808 RepID=A0ACA9Y842_9ASCO|nr:mRNA-decapping enzyme subunit 1 [[Candida] jaroonii]
MAKPKDKKKTKELTSEKALELYKNTITFNVLSRYDPSIKRLLYQTSYCVIYNFDQETEEWNKSDYQGSLSLYIREFKVPTTNQPNLQDLQNLFCYGLVLLNRSSPDLFSIGLVPNNVSNHYFPQGLGNGVTSMDVELNDSLIIVKNLTGEIFGLWVFNEVDRLKLYKLLVFCLTNDSSDL